MVRACNSQDIFLTNSGRYYDDRYDDRWQNHMWQYGGGGWGGRASDHWGNSRGGGGYWRERSRSPRRNKGGKGKGKGKGRGKGKGKGKNRPQEKGPKDHGELDDALDAWLKKFDAKIMIIASKVAKFCIRFLCH
jgi:hypothetical protein